MDLRELRIKILERQKIREEKQKLKDEEKRLKDLEVKRQKEEELLIKIIPHSFTFSKTPWGLITDKDFLSSSSLSGAPPENHAFGICRSRAHFLRTGEAGPSLSRRPRPCVIFKIMPICRWR